MRTVDWVVDHRPPHPWTRLYVRGMRARRDKQAFEGEHHTLERALEEQGKGNAPPTRWTRRRLRVRRAERAGTTVWVLRPRRREPVVRVVYLHGGGYVDPLTPDYWRLVRALAGVPAEVVVPAYPLAPGATVDDVLPELVRIAVGERGDDRPLVLMGDSAGGALALVTARLLADRGTPAQRVVCLSPWLDATLGDPEVAEVEASDPMLAESGLRAAGRWWAGRRDPSDPLVSPQHLPLEGLPRIDLHVGDRDILRPAVDAFVDRAGTAGVEVTVWEVPSMFHVWMTRAIPEGASTRRRLVSDLRALGRDRSEETG